MDSLRNLAKLYIPPMVMVPIIQTILSLPFGMSRYVIGEFTAPTKSQWNWITMVKHSTWKGAWIGPSMSDCTDNESELLQRIKSADLIIYKAHGGAFRLGHCLMYMDVFITWLELLKQKYNINALILSVEYSLAPEYKYPVPVIECVGAYQYLIDTLQIPGSKIILSGDSAGGALCIETLIRVYAPDMLQNLDAPRTNFTAELPAGLLLVSPLVSADTHTWLWEYKEDLITQSLATQVFKEYLNMPEATNQEDLHILKLARISSGYGRFAPKNLLCYVGKREVMRDVILTLTEVAKSDGSINVQVRQENFEHNWYFIRELVGYRDKHILDHCDAEFVDFAARCLKEASSTEIFVEPSSCINPDKVFVKEATIAPV